MLELTGELKAAPARERSAAPERRGERGLDFGSFLVQARTEHRKPAAPRREREEVQAPAADRPAPGPKAQEEKAKGEPDEVADAGPVEEVEENVEEGAPAEEAETGAEFVPLVQMAVAEIVRAEVGEGAAEEGGEGEAGDGGRTAVWQRAETPAVRPGDQEGGEERGLGEGEGGQEEFLPAAAEQGAEPLPKETFNLLDAAEMADPDLVVEKNPTMVVERLQQAMQGARAPVVEEAAEVVLPQVVRGLASLVRGGTAEMRLQLQPADLGEIELRVRTSEGVVRGEMLVQHPEIKQLLDQHMDRLRAALAEQGLEMGSFDVGVERDAQFAREQGKNSGGQRRSAPALAAESGTPQPVAARTGDHEVDFTA